MFEVVHIYIYMKCEGNGKRYHHRWMEWNSIKHAAAALDCTQYKQPALYSAFICMQCILKKWIDKPIQVVSCTSNISRCVNSNGNATQRYTIQQQQQQHTITMDGSFIWIQQLEKAIFKQVKQEIWHNLHLVLPFKILDVFFLLSNFLVF